MGACVRVCVWVSVVCVCVILVLQTCIDLFIIYVLGRSLTCFQTWVRQISFQIIPGTFHLGILCERQCILTFFCDLSKLNQALANLKLEVARIHKHVVHLRSLFTYTLMKKI